MKKNWALPTKQQARLRTVIEQYPRLSLPPDKQYWSMCGLNDRPGCEVDQIINSGLIEPRQWHGVELDNTTHSVNVKTYPELNWYCGDFYWTMANADAFNPGIINADLIQTPDTGAEYVARIMSFVDVPEVMLAANFVLRDRFIELKTGDYAIKKLCECQQFRVAMRRGWEYGGKCYTYPGTGRVRTVMGCLVFFRR